jgi:hypothetical protein
LEIKHDDNHYSYSILVVSPKQKGITRAYLNKSPHGKNSDLTKTVFDRLENTLHYEKAYSMILYTSNTIEPKELFNDFVGIIEHSMLEQSSKVSIINFRINWVYYRGFSRPH